ncbi:hypothetical protein D9758_018695 [Tetrapyrgos nigripes]|uniref:Uncharacterized protein n=1 Tax=Tetrapyrgos nigripes TaxID=182062 RepID=A0A8H5FDY6_9AGAR|nr:hypothetical protein D9758_018695 [Tetrapyrgos nigripes]
MNTLTWVYYQVPSDFLECQAQDFYDSRLLGMSEKEKEKQKMNGLKETFGRREASDSSRLSTPNLLVRPGSQ